MDKFGKTIRDRREKRGETRKQMAKAIKCGEGFATHIEISNHVPVSERLVRALAKHYRIPVLMLLRLSLTRNKNGKKYYKAWHIKNKKAV